VHRQPSNRVRPGREQHLGGCDECRRSPGLHGGLRVHRPLVSRRLVTAKCGAQSRKPQDEAGSASAPATGSWMPPCRCVFECVPFKQNRSRPR